MGTGRTASPTKHKEMHRFDTRSCLKLAIKEMTENVSSLGGSIKPETLKRFQTRC
jgi:triosephosphate isomerase